MSRVMFALVLLTSAANLLAADPPTSATADEKVAALVGQLSSDDFRTRDRATAALSALGQDAEPLLKAELKKDLPPSVRNSIEQVLAKAAERRRTGPTMVTVGPAGATALDAVAAVLAAGDLKLSPAGEAALRALPDRRTTAGPGGPEPMWDALVRLTADAGVAVESVSGGQVNLVPLDGGRAFVAASGAYLLGISRVETTLRTFRDLPGRRPVNVQTNEWAAPPCKLYAFVYAEPRMLAPVWMVESIEATTDDGKRLQTNRKGVAGGVAGGGDRGSEAQLALQGDLAASKSLSKLEVKARMIRQTATERIELNDLAALKNHVTLIGDYRAEVIAILPLAEGEYEYKVAVKRGTTTPAAWTVLLGLLGRTDVRVLDAQGKPLMGLGGGSSSGPEQWTQNYRVSRRPPGAPANDPAGAGEPVKLVWELPKTFEIVPATFVFHDVPLR